MRDVYADRWQAQLDDLDGFLKLSPYRRQLRRFNVGYWVIAAEMLRRHAEPGGRLLDVGCGDGRLLTTVEGHFAELTGVDISPVAIEEARRHLDGRATLLEASVEALPFAAGAFDAVACLAVIEHVFDPYQAVAELRRVVGHGGTVVVVVPNLAYLRHRLELLAGRMPITALAPSPDTGWDGAHLQYFTWRELRRLLRWAGFEPVEVSGSGAFARRRNWWPSLLCGDLVVACRAR